VPLQWQAMLKPQANLPKLAAISEECKKLATHVSELVAKNQFFTVLGGDHSCAIGTWSGVHAALKNNVGLIWFDAHMDSHTPETTLTGNIHGMPLACLLGHGELLLTNILTTGPQIRPEHVCLIGIRSFEQGEADLLKQLNVRIFFIDEVKERGLAAVMQDALAIVTKDTAGFGISLDLDSVDPEDAPGTGTPELNGISGKELCQALQRLSQHPKLLGLEIAEFDPHRDKNHVTEKLIVNLLSSIQS